MVLQTKVRLWGRDIGAVVWDEARRLGIFQYEPGFLRSGIQISPIHVPLRAGPFDFPGLSPQTFKGLPGFLADSLPDKFGNALIDAWLASQGRAPGSMNPVERLCYTGTRGMGALEFHPEQGVTSGSDHAIEISAMVELSSAVLRQRGDLQGYLNGKSDKAALSQILRIGTSAGGARAKAILAWNEETGEFRSGQLPAGSGFSYWLMKFDGVDENSDKELSDPKGFGRIEYACSIVADRAGVQMSRCRLHEEGGRAHFMTERFDRLEGGEKIHMLSLGGMQHFDFNQPQAYSYEQAIMTLRQIGAPPEDLSEQVRRAFLNILLRNQDDHVKNIAFLMNKKGEWRLSPAFDVCYAFNPDGAWTSRHQMSLQGKTDGFTKADLIAFAKYAGVKAPAARKIYDQVQYAVSSWRECAGEAGVFDAHVEMVARGLRTELPEA